MKSLSASRVRRTGGCCRGLWSCRVASSSLTLALGGVPLLLLAVGLPTPLVAHAQGARGREGNGRSCGRGRPQRLSRRSQIEEHGRFVKFYGVHTALCLTPLLRSTPMRTVPSHSSAVYDHPTNYLQPLARETHTYLAYDSCPASCMAGRVPTPDHRCPGCCTAKSRCLHDISSWVGSRRPLLELLERLLVRRQVGVCICARWCCLQTGLHVLLSYECLEACSALCVLLYW